MLSPDPSANSYDRLGFTISLALAMHAAIILGIGFAPNDPASQSGVSRLEITLAQHSSDSVDKADYLAQLNQQASGTQEHKAELTTTQQAEFHDTVIRDISPVLQSSGVPSEPQQQTPQLSTQKSQFKVNKQDQQQDDQVRVANASLNLLQRQLEIASLEARLDEQKQAFAKRPRIHRLTSVATQASVDAQYLYAWQSRIEKIGNQHYPERARQQELYGSLRLLVSINASGSVHNIELLHSSGHRVLDDAAMRIVRVAAPFPAFSPSMRKKADILEIIRTWHFKKNRFTSSS